MQANIIFATHILPWEVISDPEDSTEKLIPRKRHSALFAAIQSFAKYHVGIIRTAQDTTVKEFQARNCYPIQVDPETAYVW